MRKIFVTLSIILNIVLCDFAFANDLLKDLSFVENQIFNKSYSKDNLEDRVERLELNIYGAIQDGKLLTRINNLKNAVTNVSQGGKGLQYAVKLFNLAGNSIMTDNYNFSNNSYFNNYNNGYSFRLPQLKQYRSSRIDYNNYNKYNMYNPYNSYPTDFSIGTGVKILKD